MRTLADLMSGYAQSGVLMWIGLRAERLVPPVSVQSANIGESGLEGDHGRPGKRAVTLIQAEHLPVIGSMMGQGPVDAAILRRNLVVQGINLNALKGRQLQIGRVVVEISTICAPCSRMEAALGPGGYSAVRGHGGWCALVVKPGKIMVGDRVTPLPMLSNLAGDA
ncbi:MAG: MOSC domain-containing protein [Sulfitobacter sp.]